MTYDGEPLRVLLTRTQEDCELWGSQLEGLGLRPVSYPCIECKALPGAEVRLLSELGSHDWLALTSAKAAELVGAACVGQTLALPRVACVGPKTAEACRQHLTEPTLVAAGGTAQDLGASLVTRLAPGERVLFATAQEGLSDLEDILGAERTTRMALYETSPIEDAMLPPQHDAIFFASPSAVEGFSRRAGVPAPGARLVALGPSTAREISQRGWGPVLVATERSLRGMVAILSEVRSTPGELPCNH